MNTQEIYDVIIIGAGPTGLAAALYTSREGYKTLVLEFAVIGGMAALTADIENYPGFEEGIGGLELSDKLYKQAKRFGAEIKLGVKVDKIEQSGEIVTLSRDNGEAFTGKSVIIATGSTYRELGIAGEKELIGKGIHFCPTCDGPVYRGKDMIVVGGGNSALQESVFLSRFATKITILVRKQQFSGSQVLIDEVMALPNVEVRYGRSISSFIETEGKFSGVKLNVEGQTELETIEAPALFELIGLLPNTTFLNKTIKLDEYNFVKTDMHFQTNMPGVFCAGDVRSGSTWQIASAVGEGASAALEVRKYLDGIGKNASA